MEDFNPKKFANLSPDKRALRVYLSETTIKYIEEWQALNNVSNRSKAIEGLVLMSIRDARMLGISAIFQDMIRRTMTQEFDKFAKLIAHTSLEAGAAKEASQHIYWWILLQEMAGYLDELGAEESPTVAGIDDLFSVDPNSEEGAVLIEFFKSRKQRFNDRAITQLKQPFELRDILAELMIGDQGSEDE